MEGSTSMEDLRCQKKKGKKERKGLNEEKAPANAGSAGAGEREEELTLSSGNGDRGLPGS